MHVAWGFTLFKLRNLGIKLFDVSNHNAGPEVIKLLTWSTELSMDFIQPINVKMPTTVGILTFISRIN